jgi:hypothetical protein
MRLIIQTVADISLNYFRSQTFKTVADYGKNSVMVQFEKLPVVWLASSVVTSN